ncbi:MAG: hypothetical protein IKP19_10410 [Oscillospiraceae bacterium]|nr:hypothetical protein [Oscillospiraceae bacterium]
MVHFWRRNPLIYNEISKELLCIANKGNSIIYANNFFCITKRKPCCYEYSFFYRTKANRAVLNEKQGEKRLRFELFSVLVKEQPSRNSVGPAPQLTKEAHDLLKNMLTLQLFTLTISLALQIVLLTQFIARPHSNILVIILATILGVGVLIQAVRFFRIRAAIIKLFNRVSIGGRFSD